MYMTAYVTSIVFIVVFFVSSPAKSQFVSSESDEENGENIGINTIVNGMERLSLSQSINIKKLDEIDNKITSLNDAFIKHVEDEKPYEWLTPISNLVAVLIGGLISALVSYLVQRRQTKFEINKSLMDWKVKQLSELYGPLYALLHQSNAIYRQMNILLSKTDSSVFRLIEDSEKTDFDKKIFEIFENNEWVIFRTITHINKVYGKGYGIESYFDELLEIGNRMVNIVENKAGYIREDQSELADVFGKYLAHYTVLCQLHRQMKNSLEAKNETIAAQKSAMPVDHTAAFPREIQGLVQMGYRKLNRELNSWGEKGGMTE